MQLSLIKDEYKTKINENEYIDLRKIIDYMNVYIKRIIPTMSIAMEEEVVYTYFYTPSHYKNRYTYLTPVWDEQNENEKMKKNMLYQQKLLCLENENMRYNYFDNNKSFTYYLQNASANLKQL